MIPLTPAQAKNLLQNLDSVAPHNGFQVPLDLFTALAADRMTGDRLYTVLSYLAAGLDTTVALDSVLHPPVAGIAAEIGLEMIAHPALRLIYYRVNTARLLRALARLLGITEDIARLLLAQPTALMYRDYIRSPQWDVRRSAAVKADGNRCRKCGARGKLEVHHISYVRMGQERPEDLITLCPKCHEVMDQRSGFGKGRTRMVKHG